VNVSDDERKIRELIETWHRASAAGDVDAVLPLMAEDVVFLTPGQPPRRGREWFGTAMRVMLRTHSMASKFEIVEIQVAGNRAHCWTQLWVTVTPLAGGPAMRRSGNALSLLRREPNGAWVVYRDANMLAVEEG
jgi:uncharacterized protein (TIGR02246 family)